MAKRTRILALMMAILVLAVVLTSAIYIAAEADHDCVGEHCPVCEQILACQSTIRFLSFVVLAAALLTNAGRLCRILLPAAACAATSITPVTLKVKLSD